MLGSDSKTTLEKTAVQTSGSYVAAPATYDRSADPAWLGWLRGRVPGYAPPVYRRFSYLQVVVFAGVMALLGYIMSVGTYDSHDLGVMTTSFTYGIAAVGLYFAYTLGGLFAFSQAAFMGLGAFTSAKVTLSGTSDPRGGDQPFIVGFLVSAAVCFVIALLVGFVLSRTRGLYFAIGALAVAELLGIAFANWDWLAGSTSGTVSGIKPISFAGHEFFTAGEQFWFTGALFVVVLLLSMLVERSPLRRSALAAKEIQRVGQANGIPVYRVAIMLFAYGCALAGLAGSLQAHQISAISPDGFGIGLAINMYLMLLLGGVRSIWGPVVGAMVYAWLPELLRPVKEYEQVVYSCLLLVIIVLLPRGIVGTLEYWGREVMRRVKSH